ncbi:bifunctional 3'-5' exonuclease/DNA polymerase [Zafaria sp. J156]|uniref:bifunctional 3'-5' exonuclease/DNA polymerase n=1 Tax=Zafaria sp. J156 TaxID=3116490 RepID=UPI002E79446E|nr:bifunctional 3'-5' exonuclease/DNA polymerase [Zafaria sp. J156]MEE1621353.1 bifunctional 3'-5' exonuclease/DNA polymerase [Zafaria sp. J156]
MPRYALLATHSSGQPPAEAGAASGVVLFLDASGNPEGHPVAAFAGQLPGVVREIESRGLRWVWEHTRDWYPQLLAAGVRIERAHDLALSRAILRHAPAAAGSAYAAGLGTAGDDAAPVPAALLPPPRTPANQGSLFEEPPPAAASAEALAAEFARQLAAVDASPQGRRLQLLLAAESAGALVAAEMEHHGVPWDTARHVALLEDSLGPRTPAGSRPARLEELAAELRAALGAPQLNPDSQQELLRALHRCGIEARSTSQWELAEFDHPALEVLNRYKKLSRLHSANGWAWLDAWVSEGRFRPEYVVGGVVTGRWSSRGGGALQIPHSIRDAVRPDPGHVLVVADAAQLEPRILAALSRDRALADAARGRDLYQGIADLGFGGDRASAKIAMLGAMYGGTSGESGRLLPQLTRTFPQAVAFVEDAARTGAAGGDVATYLGRGAPPASSAWRAGQRSTTADEQRRADAAARARGRFTRNFVVQGTAAEWALCWLGGLRRRLHAESVPLGRGGLVFFLHDEVMLHVPAESAGQVVRIVQESAAEAAELIFGRIPVEFPVGVATVDSYADAK